jgi:hypothetical protein
MTKLVLGLSIVALVAPSTFAFHEPTALADVGAPSPAIALQLPRGIHLGRDGRYVQPVCDPAAPLHCLAERVLPESFRPGDYHPLQVAPGGGGQVCNGSAGPPGESAPPAGAMTPSDVVAAYHIPAASSAAGKIVALVDMPDSHAYDELSAYRQAFGIPALPQCPGGLPDGKTPCFASVDQNGNPSDPSLDCAGADPESGLDMGMVSAACPDCSILFVEMTGAMQQGGISPQDFITTTATAARLGAVATSISFGGPEQGESSAPTGYTTPGHLVLAASGDLGYLLEGEQFGGGHSPSYPASAPDVLSVGGTLLQKGASDYSEIVWNDRTGATGSGCSTQFPMPAFQTKFGTSHFGSCTNRASVDLSAAADFSPGTQGGGIASYDSHDQWMPMAGTSAASPLVAAILTRVGVAAQIANDFGWVYANGAAFHDITSGTDDRDGLCQAGDVMCTAGPGWDGPSGVGTPDATKLAALAGGDGSPGADAGAGATTDAGADSSAGAGTTATSDAGVSPGSGSGTSSGESPGVDAGAASGSSNADTGTFGPATQRGCACAAAGRAGTAEGAGALAMAVALLMGFARRASARSARRGAP